MRTIPRTRSWLLALVVAAALVGADGGSAAAGKKVNGTVGPGFTIGLTSNGKKVTKLKPESRIASSSATGQAFTTSTSVARDSIAC